MKQFFSTHRFRRNDARFLPCFSRLSSRFSRHTSPSWTHRIFTSSAVDREGRLNEFANKDEAEKEQEKNIVKKKEPKDVPVVLPGGHKQPEDTQASSAAETLPRFSSSSSSSVLPTPSSSSSSTALSVSPAEYSRLPSIPWTYHQEFPPDSRYQWMRDALCANKRIFSISAQEISTVKNLAVLSISVGTVFGIGFYEALLSMEYMPLTQLLTSPSHLELLPSSLSHYTYALTYGFRNILPSIIWSSTELDLIIRSYGEDPSLLLKSVVLDSSPGSPSPSSSPLSPPSAGQLTAEDAILKIQLQSLRTLRSVIAGFVMVAQVLRMMVVGLQSNNIYRYALERVVWCNSGVMYVGATICRNVLSLDPVCMHASLHPSALKMRCFFNHVSIAKPTSHLILLLFHAPCSTRPVHIALSTRMKPHTITHPRILYLYINV